MHTISMEDLGRVLTALGERIEAEAVPRCDYEGCGRAASEIEPEGIVDEEPLRFGVRFGVRFLCGDHAEDEAAQMARNDLQSYRESIS